MGFWRELRRRITFDRCGAQLAVLLAREGKIRKRRSRDSEPRESGAAVLKKTFVSERAVFQTLPPQTLAAPPLTNFAFARQLRFRRGNSSRKYVCARRLQLRRLVRTQSRDRDRSRREVELLENYKYPVPIFIYFLLVFFFHPHFSIRHPPSAIRCHPVRVLYSIYGAQ